MSPLITIVMPARNAEPWIGHTLRSVVAQSLKDWECIVIDDGSTDATVALASACGDPRIRVISQGQSGVSAARNAGLALAQGEFVTFLDADDIWHPRALERMIAPLVSCSGITLAWGDFVRFEDKTHRELPLPTTRLWQSGEAWSDMLVDNFMPFGTFCVRCSAAKALRFDVSLRIGEDRDWLLRLLKGRKAVHVPHLVHYYRQRSDSSMRDIQRFLEDEDKMILPHVHAPDVAPHLRRRALSALAFHRAVLLAKLPGKKLAAGLQFLFALWLDPLYCENYLRPLRKLFAMIPSSRYVDLPVHGSYE